MLPPPAVSVRNGPRSCQVPGRPGIAARGTSRSSKLPRRRGPRPECPLNDVRIHGLAAGGSWPRPGHRPALAPLHPRPAVQANGAPRAASDPNPITAVIMYRRSSWQLRLPGPRDDPAAAPHRRRARLAGMRGAGDFLPIQSGRPPAAMYRDHALADRPARRRAPAMHAETAVALSDAVRTGIVPRRTRSGCGNMRPAFAPGSQGLSCAQRHRPSSGPR